MFWLRCGKLNQVEQLSAATRIAWCYGRYTPTLIIITCLLIFTAIAQGDEGLKVEMTQKPCETDFLGMPTEITVKRLPPNMISVGVVKALSGGLEYSNPKVEYAEFGLALYVETRPLGEHIFLCQCRLEANFLITIDANMFSHINHVYLLENNYVVTHISMDNKRDDD